MFGPGDVVAFHSDIANKRKYHLCLSQGGHFFFINTPKDPPYEGDLIVPCTEISCLNPTESGNSAISCSMVVVQTNAELRANGADKLGTVSNATLKKVLAFVETNDALTDEERDLVLDGLGDWI